MYCAILDYVCEEYNNPSDFFLDIVMGEAKPAVHARKYCIHIKQNVHGILVVSYLQNFFGISLLIKQSTNRRREDGR